ncbi:aminoglycoside phosphotransferase [Planomonospora sphaerica]|uniref:Aminoglycoside phosphotransferase n=1 Tax=Planomonospora sphaerica TaxID=161355 RepID=A0A171BGM4_9ACTN|nr:aminoglycoside phosphotransferase [Planomonospora sphaerica]
MAAVTNDAPGAASGTAGTLSGTAGGVPGTGGGPAPEWAAEQDVREDDAAALVGGQFPDLRGAPVRLLATGWDNTVHLVGERWAFRFPRRAVALPGVEREIATLPVLAERLPLALPVPVRVGRPSEAYPWPFWGAELIPGEELAEAELSADGRMRAAAGLGAFLRALHDPELAAEAGGGLPVDPMRRADPGVRAAMARERLGRLVRRGAWTPDPAVDRLLADGEKAGPPPGPAVVSHGDLHLRHLLVGPDGRATGVIDWGDLCRADPAVDLSLAYAGFDGDARTALLSAYGRPVNAGRELAARVLAVCLCAVLADYAESTGRTRLLAASLSGLRRAVGD